MPKITKRKSKRVKIKRRRATASIIPLDDGETGSAVELATDAKLRAAGYWFDIAEANRVCSFVTLCRHSKGKWAGLPMELAAWQRQKIRRLFGWRRPDGTRRYRRTYWWVPRKNGKSTLAAIVALLLVAADGEPGAQVFSAAADKEQAEIVFSEAKNMVESSEELSAGCTRYRHALMFAEGGGIFRAISSKPGTKHGVNVHGVVIDEVHALKGRSLYDVLTSASGARVQPLEVVISTAGDNIGSFAYELWEYSIKVSTGVLEDIEFLPVVYAADPEDDWRSPATWAKANPNLGVSINADFLASELQKTKGMPGRIAAFKQLYLNLWVQSSLSFIPLDKWRACVSPPRPMAQYRGRKCWGGLDLSQTTDLTALALVFEPEQHADPMDVVVFFWVPEETVHERSHEDNVQYSSWLDRRFIRATPGNVIDYNRVEHDIVKISRYVDIQELAYDSWGATQISQRLQDEHGLKLAKFGQRFKEMSPAMKELERLILSRGMRIADNPALTWQASNVVARRDTAGNIKPDKSRAANRIDGIVALIMAISRASLRDSTASVYASRGVVVL